MYHSVSNNLHSNQSKINKCTPLKSIMELEHEGFQLQNLLFGSVLGFYVSFRGPLVALNQLPSTKKVTSWFGVWGLGGLGFDTGIPFIKNPFHKGNPQNPKPLGPKPPSLTIIIGILRGNATFFPRK